MGKPFGVLDDEPFNYEEALKRRNRPGQPNKLSSDQWAEIAERHLCGETIAHMATEFRIAQNTISHQLSEREIQAKAKKIGAKAIRDPRLRKFLSEARSMLWSADNQIDDRHPQYFKWKDEVGVLKDRHHLSYGAAAIQATKNYKILWPLFRKYNVEQFDKFPTSHPLITRYKSQGYDNHEGNLKLNVTNEQIEQDHRANLDWAIAAAGEFRRTGSPPQSCPNDAAFFLYEQAVGSPEAFLARFTTVMSKTEVLSKDDSRIQSNRSLDEINSMLNALSEKEEKSDE